MSNPYSYENKRVVVTGGATGVGARLYLLGRAALRRWWWSENAGGSPAPNGPLPA